MKKIESLEQYYTVINDAKNRLGRLTTNSTMFPETITRYIELGRLLFEEVDAGVVLYTDEERFYQAFYYVRPEIKFIVNKKDRLVLIQNVYKGEKKQSIKNIEDCLRNSGFELKDVMRHGVFSGYDKIPSIKRSLKPVNRILEKEGLKFEWLRREQIQEMLDFQLKIKEIPVYLFPYFTDDELVIEADEERLCCIMDSEGKIVAARHLVVNGKKAYGWVGIEEGYKGTYGLALVFLCHALDYIEKNDIKMCSWVDEKNTPSLQYHERLGTDWTGHLMDEWVLE